MSTRISPKHNIEYDLTIKKVRRMSISISKQGRVSVRIPMGLKPLNADIFVDDKHQWISRQLKAFEHYIFLPELSDKQKKICRQHVLMRASLLMQDDIVIRPKKIFVRFSSTRWGSCSSLGNISLNGYLAYLPDSIFEYVFWHEVTHLSCMNHSSTFWSLLEKKVAEPKKIRSALRQYRLP